MPTIRNYLSLIKFSHTIFAMPFALIGFFLGIATGLFEQVVKIPGQGIDAETRINRDFAMLFILVILCMIFARSAAMAFNRYLDRKWDALNPRTAVREIPSGVISPVYALGFTIISSFLFFVTCFFINRICFFLSPVALLVVLGYSYTKRFTPLCHLILGLGLSLAPIGAYLAVTGTFDWLPILFSVAVLFWVSGFDIIYALQDVEFDRTHRLYSIPVWLGRKKALRVSEFLHVVSGSAIVIAGVSSTFGLMYWLGVLVFVGCLVYQHSIVKPNDLRKVNLAFMTTNGIASVVFAAFVLIDLFVHAHG